MIGGIFLIPINYGHPHAKGGQAATPRYGQNWSGSEKMSIYKKQQRGCGGGQSVWKFVISGRIGNFINAPLISDRADQCEYYSAWKNCLRLQLTF